MFELISSCLFPEGNAETKTYLNISGPQRPLQLHCSDWVNLVSLAQVIWTNLTQANILDLALIHKCLDKSQWLYECLTPTCTGRGVLYKLPTLLIAHLACQLRLGICSYACSRCLMLAIPRTALLY